MVGLILFMAYLVSVLAEIVPDKITLAADTTNSHSMLISEVEIMCRGLRSGPEMGQKWGSR